MYTDQAATGSAESSIRSYELFGKGIVLATRYEQLRKLYQLPGEGHLICLQSSIYQALSKEQKELFTRMELEPGQARIRDNEMATDFYYCRIPVASKQRQTA